MAAVADGWFASAYNATPDQYREARVRLDEHLRAAGREPDDFPDAIATMWLFVTDSRREPGTRAHRRASPSAKP